MHTNHGAMFVDGRRAWCVCTRVVVDFNAYEVSDDVGLIRVNTLACRWQIRAAARHAGFHQPGVLARTLRNRAIP